MKKSFVFKKIRARASAIGGIAVAAGGLSDRLFLAEAVEEV